MDDIEISKQKFHQYKGSISIKNIDVNKIILSYRSVLQKKKKRFKCFTGYKDDKN